MNINYVKDKKSFLLQYILVVFDLILPHYYQSLSFSLTANIICNKSQKVKLF